MNITYVAAILQILFGFAALIFGWVDPVVAIGLVTTGFGVFGIRKTVGNQLGSTSRSAVHW